MRQVLQNLKDGSTTAVELPCPQIQSGQLLIRTACTLISAGTEKMMIDFGKANPIDKARQQPEKVRMVIDKIRTDGLLPTLNAVFNKLDQPLALGYCNVGRVMDKGDRTFGFELGDRIASNGNHAEVVSVPVNLCARIPDAVTDEEAAFTVLGAISLQGIRLVQPTLGEAVVVTGLGLIGQLTVQLLRANGCRVLGIDFDPKRLAIAKSFGAEVVDLSAGEDPVTAAESFSRGRGVDAVMVTAATKSSEPMHQAALMCRKRGRIVLVGVTGLKLLRDDFFKKELTFQVSASYGPGRYDPNYEEKGHDYPIGFVRWTEQRNFEAVLDMMSSGKLDVKPLISHRFDLDEIENAYSLVAGSNEAMGILLKYPTNFEKSDQLVRRSSIELEQKTNRKAHKNQEVPLSVGFIGSGSYALSVLIPAFKKAGTRLATVSSSGGISGTHAAKKHGFNASTTDTASLLVDPTIGTLVVTTRHNSHANIVIAALEAGKNVFVEKPLCLTLDELDKIEHAAIGRMIMVGFNRRFAPHVQKIKSLLTGVQGPKAFVMTVNAGFIATDHWVQDSQVGGGRIVGEACHFIDLLRYLADSKILSHQLVKMDTKTNDSVSITLLFENGSIGTVHYLANGSKAFPKERLEVFASGRVIQLDNFRKMRGFGWPNFKKMNLWKQDKGQNACTEAFVVSVARGIEAPIPLDELLEVSRVSIELGNAL